MTKGDASEARREMLEVTLFVASLQPASVSTSLSKIPWTPTLVTQTNTSLEKMLTSFGSSQE